MPSPGAVEARAIAARAASWHSAFRSAGERPASIARGRPEGPRPGRLITKRHTRVNTPIQMRSLSDFVFFGPRLALTIGGEAARRVPNLVAASYRSVFELLGDRLRESGDDTNAARVKATAPAGTEPPESEPGAPKADAERAEVVPNVPQAVDGGFPEPSGKDPGDLSGDPSPHHALNTPVGAPDPTEWPDPYEEREDPRDPPDPDGEAFGEEPHPPVGSTSTSDPHPDADVEAPNANPPQRDKLDQ